MNDFEVRNIKDAWDVAMYHWSRRESLDYSNDETLMAWFVYNNEYKRWIRIWETLFNVAM